jgi:hypothetical protein
MHAPGSAAVVVRDASGTEQRQTVSVLSGGAVEMEFSGDAPRATTVAPPPSAALPPPGAETKRPATSETTSGSWAIPAAIGSGVFMLAGSAVFIGFGSTSHATYNRLSSECGPSFCGPDQRHDADTAKRQQTIANIGLIAAGVAAVATVAFIVVAVASPSRP